jgi:hypothetical protein
MTRTYAFYCIDNGDNMSARVYIVKGRGGVMRYCYPSGCLAVIRQRIPRCQAAREMAVLRRESHTLQKRSRNV